MGYISVDKGNITCGKQRKACDVRQLKKTPKGLKNQIWWAIEESNL